jgi:hypothetical protein
VLLNLKIKMFEKVCIMSDETDIPSSDEIVDSASYIIYVLSLFIQYSNMSEFYNCIRKYINSDEAKEEAKVMEKYNLPLDKTIDEGRDDIRDIYRDVNEVNLTSSTGYRTINIDASFSGGFGMREPVKGMFTDLELEYLNEVYSDENRYSQTVIYVTQNIIRMSRFENKKEATYLNILTLNLAFNMKNSDLKNIRFKNVLNDCLKELYNKNEKKIETRKKSFGFYNYLIIGLLVCLYGYFVYASMH